jgi:serine/threonine protein kinase
MMLTIGTSIKGNGDDSFTLDEIIGQGGFGYVFKAHRSSDNATFAVKTMLPSFANSTTAEAFKNEMLLAGKVKGENIIRYEYIHAGDKYPEMPPYIIMEYADGGTLTQILDEQRKTGKMFDQSLLLSIYKQLANGMNEVNSFLVHRDIKPDNILLCGNDLKISDFGLSKVAIEGTRSFSFKGGGTPLYMAPESWDYSKNTTQMDIYSMGIVFYELAALRYPYQPKPITIEESKNAHMYSRAENLKMANGYLTPSLISVISRMMEKPTQRRFTSWQEIIQLLEEQKEPESLIEKFAARAVSVRSESDATLQAIETERMKKDKERINFCKLIRSQFQNAIAQLLVSYTEEINGQYAGSEKIRISSPSILEGTDVNFHWTMKIPPNNTVTIKMEAILKDNFKRTVHVDRFFGDGGTRVEHYIPQYKGKKILAWGEVSNSADYGFNLLLIEGEGLYGDWIVMNNSNSFSHVSGKERKEPFHFRLNELPNEIDKVQITHLYSAEFLPFEDELFLSQVHRLAFELK